MILFSCYENTTPLRWKGKECWTGERRRDNNVGTRPLDQPNTFLPRRQLPGDGSRGSDPGPGDPASRPEGHIWQPPAACQLLAMWRMAASGADGRDSRWGGRSWAWEPFLMVSTLPGMEAFLGTASGWASGRGLGSAKPGKSRGNSGRASALPTAPAFALKQLDIHHLYLAGPQTTAYRGKEPGSQTEKTAGQEKAKARGERGQKFMPACVDSFLAHLPP